MAYSPQDVYARHLVSVRGYPLWTPEPNMSLPAIYVREGLRIGDVGVVVPEDGSFDVLFNVCLPPTHKLHQETGVPDNFVPIPVKECDISKFPEAEAAGRIISTTSVARVRSTDPPGEDPARRAQPGPLNYEFTLSSHEGAVLILPEGAGRYYLRDEGLFRDEAIQHAVDWYTFAQRRGRIISHDSLYLITGFHKALSWSLAAYQHGQGAAIREASAQFKALQVGRGNIAASYTWETTQAMDWRVGPSDQYYNSNGVPNQTVFIQGYKIAVREGILGRKKVEVKADFPSVRPYLVKFSSDSWFSTLWRRVFGDDSGSMSTTQVGMVAGSNTRATGSNLPAGGDDNGDVGDDVMIHRFPRIIKPFHPSDIINQHLLRMDPSATIAVTHDSIWTTLLDKGLLEPEQLTRNKHFIAVVMGNYSMTPIHEGAVYLQSTVIKNEVQGGASQSGFRQTVVAKKRAVQGMSQRNASKNNSLFSKSSKFGPHVKTQATGINQAHGISGSAKTPGGSDVAGTPFTGYKRLGTPTEADTMQTINVVLFGETGVGKSSVINLIAQKEVANVSPNDKRPPMQPTCYNISFDGLDFSIFETLGGLNGPKDKSYFDAIESAYRLIVDLRAAGGIHLLLCCMRAGKITQLAQSHYRMFFKDLCRGGVPIVLVFTGLEDEDVMEDWWTRNRVDIELFGIEAHGHACITAVKGSSGDERGKYTESQQTIRELLKKHYLRTGAFKSDKTDRLAMAGKGIKNVTKNQTGREECRERIVG